jgi:hypothetical protein
MSKEIESVSAELFDKIRSRFGNVSLGDEYAKAEQDPEKARFFSFDYSSMSHDSTSDRTDTHGKVTINLIDEKSLKVYYVNDMVHDMNDEQRRQWYEFLRGLRKFSKRNGLRYDVRDLDKPLNIKDIRQQANVDDVATSNDISITESKLYASGNKSKLSIGEHGNCKLLIHHSERIDPEKRGAHTRKIDRIFLETELGERYLLSSKNLRGAWAMAEHVNQGGNPIDERGQHITQICNEIATLRKFANVARHRQFEDEDTSEIARKALKDYEEKKRLIDRLRKERYYKQYFESWSNESKQQLDDENLNSIRERFAKKVYDPRVEDALPLLANHLNELETWVEEISEGTWATPDSTDKIQAIQHLLSSPILASRAEDDLRGLIGDDKLYDKIDQYKNDQPDYDVRGIVRQWLSNNMPEIASKISSDNTYDHHTNFIAPTSPQNDNSNEYGSSTMDEPVTESQGDLSFLRLLAGIK